MNKILLVGFLSLTAAGMYGCAGDASDVEESTDDALHAGQVQEVSCSSNEYRYNSCSVNGRVRSVRLVRQRSSARCDQGTGWGYQPGQNFFWVDKGCRGDFEVELQGGGLRTEQLDCSSSNYAFQRCMTDMTQIRTMRLVRQQSSAACTQGSTFGNDSNSIWVDRGCRGTFEISGW